MERLLLRRGPETEELARLVKVGRVMVDHADGALRHGAATGRRRGRPVGLEGRRRYGDASVRASAASQRLQISAGAATHHPADLDSGRDISA
jgi:hypothetical protein